MSKGVKHNCAVASNNVIKITAYITNRFGLDKSLRAVI